MKAKMVLYLRPSVADKFLMTRELYIEPAVLAIPDFVFDFTEDAHNETETFNHFRLADKEALIPVARKHIDLGIWHVRVDWRYVPDYDFYERGEDPEYFNHIVTELLRRGWQVDQEFWDDPRLCKETKELMHESFHGPVTSKPPAPA